MAFKFHDPAPYLFEGGDLLLGLDDEGRKIGISTERHALTIGGSRTGKGAGLLVPNARLWPHNLLVIDPKGENAALTWEARAAKGQAVYVLDPFEVADVPAELRASFNPLADIDPDSPRARGAVRRIGSGLVVSHNKDHMEWTEGARSILAGLCAFIIADAPAEKRSFAMVRKMLMQRADLLLIDAQAMAQDSRMGGLIRSAGVMIETALTADKAIERQFLGLAQSSTQWLDDEAIAGTLGASDFRLSDLKADKASVFLVLPPDYLAEYSAFLRLFVQSALHAMAAPVEGGQKCLFLLDEFFSLGKIDDIAKAAGLMPSYGVHLWPFLQDLGQLQELYGATGGETFFGNADAWIFLGNSDTLTLRYASDIIGDLTPAEIMPEPPKIDFTKVEFKKGKPFQASGGFWWTEPTQRQLEDHRASQETRRSEHQTEEENRRRAHEANEENRRREVDAENARRRAEYDHAMKQVGRKRLTPDQIADIVGKGEGDKVANSLIAVLPRRRILNLKVAAYFNAPDPYRGAGLELVERRRAKQQEEQRRAAAYLTDVRRQKEEEQRRAIEHKRQEADMREWWSNTIKSMPSNEQSITDLANLYDRRAPVDRAYKTTAFPCIVAAICLDSVMKKCQPAADLREKWEPYVAEFLNGRPLSYIGPDTLNDFLAMWGEGGISPTLLTSAPDAGKFPAPDRDAQGALMYYTVCDMWHGGRAPTVGAVSSYAPKHGGGKCRDDTAKAISITFEASEARALDDGPAYIRPFGVTIGSQCRALIVLEYQGARYTFAAWVEDGKISANWKMTHGGDTAYLARAMSDDLALHVSIPADDAGKERLLYEIAHSLGYKRYDFTPSAAEQTTVQATDNQAAALPVLDHGQDESATFH